jgi:hypothetical protein
LESRWGKLESCGGKQKGVAESRRSNGGNGWMAGMADGMVEWQKWLHTYYLRYTPMTSTPTPTMTTTTTTTTL